MLNPNPKCLDAIEYLPIKASLESINSSIYNIISCTVVKLGHTEGIEREKTSSQKSHGIALYF